LKSISIDAIAISNQVLGCCSHAASLDKLMCGPRSSWVCRDIEMTDLASVVSQDYENEQDPERCCWNGEEIKRNEFINMIL
jgi:hypothetical protein